MNVGPPPQTTLDLLVAQDQDRGSAFAILAPGRPPIPYAALRTGIEHAGATLARLGFARKNRVAVALPDGPDAGLALLAVMTWATCVPLDPHLDLAACRALFARLRIDTLLVADGDNSAVTAAAYAADLPVLRLSATTPGGADLFALRAESAMPCVEPIPPRPDDIALVALTSGTTLAPKVVPITHRALFCPRRPALIESYDRCLSISPLHTTSGIGFGMTVPLGAGASTVLTPGFDAERFFAWLEEFRPTYFSASPTVHAAIIDEILRRRPTLPDSLRFVRSSSNGMTAALQAQLEALLGVPVVQGYGSTETGLIAQDSPPPGRRRSGSVGIARGTEVRILSELGETLPHGAVGEILVRGPAVMRGYENDPEANRLAFRDGWFRTGDLGYFDADDYLFIVGRLKELINRGGLKIAPAEVDAVFLRHPAVRDAATVGVPHVSLGEDVITAVILRPGESITAQQLRDYARQQLAPSKVPSSVRLVNEIPRNASGKVQRDVLAESLQRGAQTEFVLPRDPQEELVAGIFAALFDLPRVGALDNFFDLGGDSLRAVQVLSRVLAQTGIEVAPEVLFEAPTVEEFARRLRALSESAPAPAGEAPAMIRRQHRPINPTPTAGAPAKRAKRRTSR
jgi:oxalate---CoA ligase